MDNTIMLKKKAFTAKAFFNGMNWCATILKPKQFEYDTSGDSDHELVPYDAIEIIDIAKSGELVYKVDVLSFVRREFGSEHEMKFKKEFAKDKYAMGE